MKRPNIVITMSDHQQASSLFDKNIHTPSLDAIRVEGSCFTQAHHFGSCHGAVCAPSRAMLHTGQAYFNFPTLVHKEIKTKEEQASVAALADTERQESLEAIHKLPMPGELLSSSAYNSFARGGWPKGKGSNKRQLFNFQEDPLETLDMQANASYKQDIKELNRVMLEWLEGSNDPLLIQMNGV